METGRFSSRRWRRLGMGMFSAAFAVACGSDSATPGHEGQPLATTTSSNSASPSSTPGPIVTGPGTSATSTNGAPVPAPTNMDGGPVATVGPVGPEPTPSASPNGSSTTPLGPEPTPTGPDPSPTGSGEPAPVVVPSELIENFEDGDGSLLVNAGRAGHWGTYNDGTGEQVPPPGTGVDPEMGGANGTQYAVHTQGSGFTDWGAGLQVDFNNTGSGAAARQAFDASAYGGISFYARGSGEFRIEFITRAIAPTTEGGTCSAECLDAHGVMLTLTAEWQPVTLLFTDLAQEGWGTPADFSAADLLGINFKATKGAGESADFDLWLDELSFAAPGTPSTVPEVVPEPDPGPVSEPGMCGGDLGGYNGNGSVTMYWFDQGSAEVNCSYAITSRNPDSVAHVTTGDGRYFGAMNTADYDTAAMCGSCVEVTRDGGRTVMITIVDQCPIGTNPKCTRGHIDLSRDAFNQIGNESEGHLGTGNGGVTGTISWKYVPCPVTGNVQFKWKKGAAEDQFWDELLVQNHPYAITSVEIDGQPATRKEYNYWEPPEGVISASKTKYRVRVTDVTGAVIESSVERLTGDVDSQLQMSCQ